MSSSNPDRLTNRHAFYSLLRSYGINTIFGNPGSTEMPMLKNFPSDMHYVLGLQEASVVAMADGYAQATRKPAVVSLHTAAGTGNAMGAMLTANLNKTPIVIIAGQQTRQMLLGDPMLTNRDPTVLPMPNVKWAYQPARAEDVPGAIIRAFAMVSMPPAGPVYLSIPLDDWDVSIPLIPPPRCVSTRIGPDLEQLSSFTSAVKSAKHVALVYGPEVDISLAWTPAIALAELLRVPVFQTPFCQRATFPEIHPLWKGQLPSARGPLASKLAPFDLVLVVGGEIWRFYPWVPGPICPPGTKILQITNDPHDAAAAITGDALLSDAKLALEALLTLLEPHGPSIRTASESAGVDPHAHTSHVAEVLSQTAPSHPPSHPGPPTALEVFTRLSALRPENSILLNESPSNGNDLQHAWPTIHPESYLGFASGCLGWAVPASVGVAVAQKQLDTNRPVICVVGDGSLHYSPQALYTAVKEKVGIVFLVPMNREYAILKEFAVLEDTPDVPAMEFDPDLKPRGMAEGYGVEVLRARHGAGNQDGDGRGDGRVEECFQKALDSIKRDGMPVLVEFEIDRTLRPLLAGTAGK